MKRLTLSYNQLDNNFSTPIYIDSLLLIRNSDIHQRDTRYSDLNLLCPKYTKKTERGRTMVRTIAEWNAFDQSIRKKLSIASFKRALYKTSWQYGMKMTQPHDRNKDKESGTNLMIICVRVDQRITKIKVSHRRTILCLCCGLMCQVPVQGWISTVP